MKDQYKATAIFMALAGLALFSLLTQSDGLKALAQFTGWIWTALNWALFFVAFGILNNLRHGDGEKLEQATTSARGLAESAKARTALGRAWGWGMTVMLVGLYVYSGFSVLAAMLLTGNLLIRLGRSLIVTEYEKITTKAADASA